MILTCTCKHPYQDRTYGPGKRVHNLTAKSNGTVARCTVCGYEQSFQAPGTAKATGKKAKAKDKDKGQQKTGKK